MYKKKIFYAVHTGNLDTHLAKILVYIYSLLESKMLNWNFAMGGVEWIGRVRVFNPFVPRIHNEICQTPY